MSSPIHPPPFESVPESRSFWRDLRSVMIRPRRTIRRIIDSDPDRFIRTLFLLAIVSAIAKDFDVGGLDELEAMSPELLGINLIVGITLGALLMLVAYYVLSWSATLVGGWIGGDGRFREVRAAIAWGLAPIIWAIVYRVPAVLMSLARQDEFGPPRFVIEGGRVEWSAGTMGALGTPFFVLLVILDFVVMIWFLIVASRTLGEAHRFSSWQGFGTLILAFIFPFAAIATLAFVTWIYLQRVGG